MFARKKGRLLGGGSNIVYMVACARLSEKRTCELGASRISLRDGGEKISDRMTVVICGI